ncbi:hypothetical protein QBC37DRAFT_435832 [Rhypophila decipiens]|uniref:Uncharacterized protein n=1 Tax=Rhypophila decipiens TaxID=261697 RepID=A0AAN6XUQ0_9PEZI|nr:hypothetical protein QBC37DRAFT_435832 [Rhypophila decipiens]
MSGDTLYAGVETEAEAEAEADESENLGQLLGWLESLEIKTVKPPTGIEPNLEDGTHSSKGGSSKSRRRRKKTEFQKEYNRISQRERRREKRRAKRAEKGDTNAEDDTSDFPMLWMIYLAHDRDGSLRKAFPNSVDIAGTQTERAVRDYMQRHEEGDGIEFSNLGELEEYVAIKRNEAICLRRSLNAVEKRQKHYEENLQTLSTKVVDFILADRSGIVCKESFSAIVELAVVRHAAVVLPILIMRAAGRLEELTVKLEELTVKLEQRREVDKEWVKVNDLRRKLDGEKGRTQLLTMWGSTVFPLSGAYSEIVERFKKAEARVHELEDEYTLAREGLEGKLIALEADRGSR